MFYTYLWAAFIVELLVGILVGWSLASFYFRRRDSFESVWTDQGTRDFALGTPNGSAISGKVGIVQALAQDRSSVQMQVQQLEKSLAEAETLYEKANNELQTTREALARSEAGSAKLEFEFPSLKAELAEEQSRNVAIQAQVTYFQKAATDAQALVHTLNEAKADLYRTTCRLQSELGEAQKSREKQAAQLSVYKEKMRVAIAQFERTESAK